MVWVSQYSLFNIFLFVVVLLRPFCLQWSYGLGLQFVTLAREYLFSTLSALHCDILFIKINVDAVV